MTEQEARKLAVGDRIFLKSEPEDVGTVIEVNGPSGVYVKWRSPSGPQKISAYDYSQFNWSLLGLIDRAGEALLREMERE